MLSDKLTDITDTGLDGTQQGMVGHDGSRWKQFGFCPNGARWDLQVLYRLNIAWDLA